MRRLVIATKNRGKLDEVRSMLDMRREACAPTPAPLYDVVSLEVYPDAPDVEETGSTFEQNAILKAVEYARHTGELTLADDSGLVVDALDGAPGVLSSRFAPTDAERNAKLLDLMKDVPDGQRTARFVCVIAISEPDGSVKTCEGRVEGVIAREPRGTNGFGYDPVFYVPDLGKTMAELTRDGKNAISHRGRALHQARQLLEQET